MNSDISSSLLKDQIGEFLKAMGHRASAEVISTLEAEIGRLVDSGIAERSLRVGNKVPDFTLPEALGADVSLSELLEKGPVVVTFYRGGWCPFCDLQLRSYQTILTEIHRYGGQLVAVSPQTPDRSLTDVEVKNLSFPVLTDAGNRVARQFGLVYQLSDALKALQTGFGNPIPKFNGDDSWELPMPGTFVLDQEGIVRLAHVDADYRHRLEPTALLESLERITKL